MPAVDDYLDTLEPADRAAFERLRRIALDLAPDAEQGVSYNVPALLYRGKGLLGFHAGRAALSIYPYSGRAVTAVREQLAGFSLSSGAIRFSADHPLPTAAVQDLVAFRMAEIDATR